MKTQSWQTQHGDPVALDHTILKTTVGSELHGMHISGTEDHDEMGVYIPPPSHVFGVHSVEPHFIARTAREGERSHHGDTDLNLYSLTKYLKLAAAGNPTVLAPLWAPEEHILQLNQWGSALRQQRDRFVTVQAGRKFLGYLDGQLERMKGGGRQSRVPSRPELIEQYGYDTKYASHALRLAFQGVELLTERKLILPMTDRHLEYTMKVKRGEVDFKMAVALIEFEREKLVIKVENPPKDIPETVDMEMLSNWSVDLHRGYWDSLNL